RIVQHLEGSAVTVMVELGRRVGLFESMAGLDWATSREIATQAGLNERYAREWLAAMVCGGIVEYDAVAGTFRLPPEHAAGLTGATTKDLSTVAELVTLMTRVIPEVAEAFRTGAGVPYSAYQPDFTGLMDRRSRPRYQELLLSKYLTLPEGLLSRLEAGIRVADIGCGTGCCISLMAARFPKSTFVGYDFSEPAISQARAEVEGQGLTNASFAVADGARFEAPIPFDMITAFDAIHDQADPDGVLRRIRSALAPGGLFLMVDVCASSNLHDNVGMPMASYLYTVSTMHCMSVSLAGGGPGLGTAWGHQVATRMLEDAGFTEVKLFERVDPTNSLYVAR
ncbi:MAG: class I SAM-dependent methyltransferase, partial [Candidatus Limnocylindria bacterium]